MWFYLKEVGNHGHSWKDMLEIRQEVWKLTLCFASLVFWWNQLPHPPNLLLVAQWVKIAFHIQFSLQTILVLVVQHSMKRFHKFLIPYQQSSHQPSRRLIRVQNHVRASFLGSRPCCVPFENGIVELGSTELNSPKLILWVKILGMLSI